MLMTGHRFTHDYTPQMPKHVTNDGVMALRQVGASGTAKNIVAVIPLTRPGSSPSPSQGAPFYSAESYDTPAVQLIYGGVMPLDLPRNRVEADPSDTMTWQRPYRFTY